MEAGLPVSISMFKRMTVGTVFKLLIQSFAFPSFMISK